MRNRMSALALAALASATISIAQESGTGALVRAGLDPATYVLGAASVVSVRAPWTEAARVAFGAVDVFNTEGNVARLGPGKDETLPVPRAQLIWTADSSTGYVIDCLVTGDAQSFVISRFEGGRERSHRRDVPISRDGDRLSFFLEKGTGGNVYLHSVGAPWGFKECTITAVSARTAPTGG